MTAMEFSVRRDLLPGHRTEAAALYAQAFDAYFAFAPDLRRELSGLIARGIDPERGFSAVSARGELLGLIGFEFERRRLLNLSLALLRERWGTWLGLRNWLGIAWLHRRPQPGQLLLDGVATVPAARGLGVGTRLLAEAVTFAREQGLGALRLDVVDTNQGARRLYERLGFAAQRHTQLPAFMAARLGFGGATTMLLPLDQCSAGARSSA